MKKNNFRKKEYQTTHITHHPKNKTQTYHYNFLIMTMLRPFLRSAGAFSPQTAARAFVTSNKRNPLKNNNSRAAASRLMSTQSTDDTKPPTALATLYLEDGTKLVGKSFGSHESVEGEVSYTYYICSHQSM